MTRRLIVPVIIVKPGVTKETVKPTLEALLESETQSERVETISDILDVLNEYVPTITEPGAVEQARQAWTSRFMQLARLIEQVINLGVTGWKVPLDTSTYGTLVRNINKLSVSSTVSGELKYTVE